MKSDFIVRTGDVLQIPTGDGRAYLAQVMGEHFAGIYVVVFDVVRPIADVLTGIDELATASPVFAALTLDGHIARGTWKKSGHAEASSARFLPAYKVTTGDPVRYLVEDFAGTRQRPATPLEARALPYRKTSSPAFLDRAVRAREGLTPWLPALESVRADGVLLTADLFRA